MLKATLPVLKVEKKGAAMQYSQEPYIADIANHTEGKYGYKWPIPIWSKTPNGIWYFIQRTSQFFKV